MFLLLLLNLLFSENLFFNSFDGTKLRYSVYGNENSTKILLFVQGRNEFLEKYEHLYSYFKDGYLVYAIDLRGQGLSEGERCYVDSYDTYAKDLSSFYKTIKLSHKGAKFYILAHSTGGLIVLKALINQDIDGVEKVVLSSPFLGLKNSFVASIWSRINVFIGRAKIPIYSKYSDLDFDKNDLTHDKELYMKYFNHSLKCGSATFGWLKASFEAISFVLENYKRVNTKLLILEAGQDTVVDTRVYDKLCKEINACKLNFYKDSYHEILNEINREEVFNNLF